MFPQAALEEMEGMLAQPQWSVPIQKGASLERCLRAYGKMVEEGGAQMMIVFA